MPLFVISFTSMQYSFFFLTTDVRDKMPWKPFLFAYDCSALQSFAPLVLVDLIEFK